MFSPIIGLGFSRGGKKRNNIEEIISNNVKSGAREFFTGYNPSYWNEKFGFEVSPNGRFAEHEQVTDLEDLKMICNEVHKHGKNITGNLNAWYYTEETEKEIKMIINDMMDAGVDGFICGSLGIIEYLDEISEKTFKQGYIIKGKKYKLNISTILAVYNTDAIDFLMANYPVNKVILSREVTLKEINGILDKYKNLCIEVFAEGDFCRYNNGLCFAEHKYTDRDICTVVQDDLIIKKGIKYDFRKIIKDENKDNNEKVELFMNKYQNIFDTIKEILDDIINIDNTANIGVIGDAIKVIENKYVMYYDTLQSPMSENNQNMKTLVRGYKFLKEKGEEINTDFYDYIITDMKLGMLEYTKSLKETIGGEYGLLSKEKDDLYNKADNLNLYTYVFFDKFNNIDSVKFPTRGRNYIDKLKLISDSIENKDGIIEKLDLSNTYTRTHYDLQHIFNGDKDRFYKIRKEIHKRLLNK